MLLFIGVILVMTLLAVDAFTIPYLTPVAHFINIIISPFIPFLAPITLGIFIKIWRSKEMKQAGLRTLWLIISGSQLNNHAMRVWKELANLYIWPNAKKGVTGAWCGIDECKGGYFEAALLVGVVVAEWRGWKWEGGLVDTWCVKISEAKRKTDAAKVAAKEVDGMEKGGVVDEKVVEEFPNEKKEGSSA
jgi:hypothetical protein